MSYRIVEIEVTRSLPRIALAPIESGIAFVVRRHGAPIGFHLQPVAPGRLLENDDVERLLTAANPEWRRPVPPTPPRVPVHVPSLTAVVCTHDRPALLARCLRSLRALRARRWASAVELELLVVDDAPSDERTRALVVGLADVRYVREPHVGLDFARNRAWREARGEFVAYFDDDVTVDPGWLAGFVEACAEHPDAAAVTGPVLPYALTTRAQVLFEEFGGLGHRLAKARFGATRAGDAIYPCAPGILGTGCNMALRRDVVAAIGGFDEALDTGRPLPGGGDLDILYRFVRASHPVVVEPRCLVFHEHRSDYPALRHQLWTWGLGTMAFVAKTYRSDPASRARLRRRVVQWFVQRAKSAGARCLGRATMPLGAVVAMAAGGVVGLCGEYGRSRRRVDRIRRDVAEAARRAADAAAESALTSGYRATPIRAITSATIRSQRGPANS